MRNPPASRHTWLLFLLLIHYSHGLTGWLWTAVTSLSLPSLLLVSANTTAWDTVLKTACIQAFLLLWRLTRISSLCISGIHLCFLFVATKMGPRVRCSREQHTPALPGASRYRTVPLHLLVDFEFPYWMLSGSWRKSWVLYHPQSSTRCRSLCVFMVLTCALLFSFGNNTSYEHEDYEGQSFKNRSLKVLLTLCLLFKEIITFFLQTLPALAITLKQVTYSLNPQIQQHVNPIYKLSTEAQARFASRLGLNVNSGPCYMTYYLPDTMALHAKQQKLL